MRLLRVGMIGCCAIGHGHAGKLADLDTVRVVGLCDLVRERAEHVNHTCFGSRAELFTSWRKLIDDCSLDVVCISLPPFAHSGELEYAARKGVNIFIEKPIALTTRRARSMVNAVRRAKVKCQVGFMYRFGAAVEKTKDLLDSRAAGKPGLMTARFFCNSLHSQWWRDKTRSGGQVVEQVIHVFDMTRHLLGEPDHVYCETGNVFHRNVPSYTVEDVSGTVVRFKNGAVAVVGATNGAIPGKWTGDWRLVAKNATVEFTDPNNAVIHHTETDTPTTTTIASEKDFYAAEMKDLLSVIGTKREPRVPITEGAKTLELVLAVAKSAELGRPVKIGGRKSR